MKLLNKIIKILFIKLLNKFKKILISISEFHFNFFIFLCLDF